MYYIGTDAGGTKTHTIISDGKEVLHEERSGPANYNVVGWDTAVKNIIDSITACIEKVDASGKDIALCVGMSGANNPDEQKEAKRRISKALESYNLLSFQLFNDTIIALESGTQHRNAIALICGTGSNCYGRNVDGEEVWVGGLDYLLSDEACGYMLGLQALHAATKSMDGRSDKTLIETEVYKQLKVLSMKEAARIIYAERWKKNDVARMSICIFYAAAQGDKIAIQIVDQAINEALIMAQTAARKLNMTEFDLICVGGLFAERYFADPFKEKYQALFPGALIKYPQHPPAWGAVTLAKAATE